jgi:phenylalanyl-tRNA synthetase beta chain
MKISYNWLLDYIKTTASAEELATFLTNIGLEVEGLDEKYTINGGLKGVVIGEVKTCEQHPNADKLTVAKVDIGTEGLLSIVCGAPNIKTGQKVPVATVGTTIYNNKGENFTIKKTKLRGELSEGMICAEDELGLGNSHEGIMVLDESTKPGTPASDYFKVEKDTTIEIDLTPNRVDSASHFGVARDLAAFLKQNGDDPVLKKPPVDYFKPDTTNEKVDIEIIEPDACPRYAGVCISNVKVAESPDWLKNRLKAIGLSPINNIVDITNFVLHETGHPLHAFDINKIQGKKIVVKFLPEGTKFTALDGIERELGSNDTMICDTGGAIALGGIFGGKDSGVTSETKDVFIESAYFNPVYIRRSAKRHSLSTDASFRFERGADPDMVIYALKRAAILMKDIAGGTISSQINDVYPDPIEPCKVQFSFNNAYRLIGQHIPEEIIKSILNSLEIKTLKEDDDSLLLEVPNYRVDVQREADLIEEILRIYGYNNVELPNKLNTNLSFSKRHDEEFFKNTISDLLTFNGFNEIMVNSLTSLRFYEGNSVYPQNNTVQILNPLSSDLNVLRQTLLYGGLECIAYNNNHNNSNLKFYEFGNCYQYFENHKDDNPLTNYKENLHLSLFLTGMQYVPNWLVKNEPTGFYYLKAYVELIIKRMGLDPNTLDISSATKAFFSEGLTYSYKSSPLVDFGTLDSDVLKSFDIENEVFYADIHWYNLLPLAIGHKVQYTYISRYPAVKRDLALLLDKNISYQDIKTLAFKMEKELLKQMNLFDVFESEKLGADKKSYAISFVFQHPSKTLRDKEVDKVMKKLINTFESKLNAQIR